MTAAEARAWELVQQYEKMIRGHARRWPGLNRDDHMQNLRLAVYRAAMTWDENGGMNFRGWAKGYMQACSARMPLTPVGTTYNLYYQQATRKNPQSLPKAADFRSTAQPLSPRDNRTYEDLLTSSDPSPEQAVCERLDAADFRAFILSQADGRIRDGLEHYLDSNGDSLAGSASAIGVSRQRLSLVFIEALREWQRRTRV